MSEAYPPFTLAYPDRDRWILRDILATRAGTHASKCFVVDGREGRGASFTYAETWELCRAVGAGLQARGFVPGDRLGIILPNCPEYIFAWLGAAACGAIEVPINTDYVGAFLEHTVNLTTPRGIVVAAELAGRLESCRGQLPSELQFFVAGEAAEEEEAACRLLQHDGWTAESFEELTGCGADLAHVELTPRDIGAVLFTSGTTGLSKGVRMPNAQLVFSGLEIVQAARLTEQDVLQVANPLFHGNAQFMTTIPALLVGGTIVIFERFSPSRFVARIQDHSITFVNLLGAMLDWICQQPAAPGDAETPLRCVLSCPTPASIAPAFQERFGVEAVVEVFGQTEIALPFITPYGQRRPPGAIGQAVQQFFDVRLVDSATDADVDVGQVGELAIRPKLDWIVNDGYWGMPEATAAATRNLWFHTGDGLRKDKDGWYYFTDRMKDTLRRRGENISSFEVEQAILQHPSVAECAVVAVPAAFEGGEDEVMAVLVGSGEVDEHELVVWARDRMPYFVVPRFWRRVSELPRTPSAKVRKAELRAAGVTPDTFDRERAGIEVSRTGNAAQHGSL